MHREMLDALIAQKKFPVIIEYMRIKFPEKTIIFSEYASPDLRYFPTKKGLHVLCPKSMTPIQESNLARALMGGDIFDNEEEIENASKYTMMTTMPHAGMVKENISDNRVEAFTKGIIGKVSDDGSVANPEDIENSITGLKDIFDVNRDGELDNRETTSKTNDIVAHHLGVDNLWDLPRDVVDELRGLDVDVDDIRSCPDDAVIDEDDTIDAFDSDGEALPIEECDDCGNIPIQEGFCDEDGNKIFQEARRLLNFSFRHAINVENGHKIKLVFDLKDEDIKFVGVHPDKHMASYATGIIGKEKANELSQQNRKHATENIRKNGHNNFVSSGIVKAIIDVDTNTRLKEVRAVGIVIPGMGKLSNSDDYKAGQFPEGFENKPVKEREQIAKKMGNSLQRIVHYVVGQKEPEKGSFKMTGSLNKNIGRVSNLIKKETHQKQIDEYGSTSVKNRAGKYQEGIKTARQVESVERGRGKNSSKVQEFSIPDEAWVQEHDPEYFIIQEGLFSKKPKQLKPIGRDLIAYIMTAMNEVQDTNDQAMLSGYICSKLELVDFYITVLDTRDARYIVPHPRQYLVSMQQTLTTLLGQVLKIKPINRNDKAWRVNVDYPEGYKG